MSQTTGSEAGEAEPKESTSFAEADRQPAFMFEVYLDKPVIDSIPCGLVYQIVDGNDSQLLYGRREVKLFGGGDEFMIRCNVDDWDAGSYSLVIKAFVANPPRTTETTLHFNLAFSRAMLTRHFDKTVERLSPVPRGLGND